MNIEECGVHILRDYAEMHETSSSFSSTSTGSSASMNDEYLHWNEQERGDCGSSVSMPAKSFPFTREQQQKKTRLTKTDVISRFDLSLAEAATSLNVCTTMLKRECRRMGVTRWPYRQIRKQRVRFINLGDNPWWHIKIRGGGKGRNPMLFVCLGWFHGLFP
jgi:hypothetical protein